MQKRRLIGVFNILISTCLSSENQDGQDDSDNRGICDIHDIDDFSAIFSEQKQSPTNAFDEFDNSAEFNRLWETGEIKKILQNQTNPTADEDISDIGKLFHSPDSSSDDLLNQPPPADENSSILFNQPFTNIEIQETLNSLENPVFQEQPLPPNDNKRKFPESEDGNPDTSQSKKSASEITPSYKSYIEWNPANGQKTIIKMPVRPIISNPDVSSSSNTTDDATDSIDADSTTTDGIDTYSTTTDSIDTYNTTTDNTTTDITPSNLIPDEYRNEDGTIDYYNYYLNNIFNPGNTNLLSEKIRLYTDRINIIKAVVPLSRELYPEEYLTALNRWITVHGHIIPFILDLPADDVIKSHQDSWFFFKTLLKESFNISNISKSDPLMILLYVCSLYKGHMDHIQIDSLLLRLRSMRRNTETTRETNKEVFRSNEELNEAESYLKAAKDMEVIFFEDIFRNLICILGSKHYTNILKKAAEKSNIGYEERIIFKIKLEFFTSKYFEKLYTNMLNKFNSLRAKHEIHRRHMERLSAELQKSIRCILTAVNTKKNDMGEYYTANRSKNERELETSLVSSYVNSYINHCNGCSKPCDNELYYNYKPKTAINDILKPWFIEIDGINTISKKNKIALKYMIFNTTESIVNIIEAFTMLFKAIGLFQFNHDFLNHGYFRSLNNVFSGVICHYYFDPEKIEGFFAALLKEKRHLLSNNKPRRRRVKKMVQRSSN